jgi:hypothetical protein
MQKVVGKSICDKPPPGLPSRDYRIAMLLETPPQALFDDEVNAQLDMIARSISKKQYSSAASQIVSITVTANRLGDAKLMDQFESFILPFLLDPIIKTTQKGPLTKQCHDEIELVTHTMLGVTMYGSWKQRLVSKDFLLKLSELLCSPWARLLMLEINEGLTLEIYWVLHIVRRYCGEFSFLDSEFATLEENTINLLMPPCDAVAPVKYYEWHAQSVRSMVILGILKERRVIFCLIFLLLFFLIARVFVQHHK